MGLSGIIHRGEDPELRRHRVEVLEKSVLWRVAVVALWVLIGAGVVGFAVPWLLG